MRRPELRGRLSIATEIAEIQFVQTDISLVMLGPGSLSVDARLYGRKRIDLGRSPRMR